MIDREEFEKGLSDSGLMTATELAEFEQRLPTPIPDSDIRMLADELVRHYRLTEYQVEVLCADRREPLSVADYLILDKIGQGGMGVVYKARHRDSPHLVALKILPPELCEEQTAIKRFQREVELSSRLRHPNIVAAMDHGDHNGRQFFVMEFVDGVNLAVMVEQKEAPLSTLTAFDCVLDAARGLEFAHQHDVIHRDIKPSNLLVNRDGTVKILDMGLARTIGQQQAGGGSSTTVTELTKVGAVMGTADYISPEQALNSKNADVRADIYSMGCTMYYAFTGEVMYEGETMMEKIVAHREQPIPSLCDARDDVPVEVDEIYHKMVAKKADDRYQSMAEVIRDMEACRVKYGHMWMIRRFISEGKLK